MNASAESSSYESVAHSLGETEMQMRKFCYESGSKKQWAARLRAYATVSERRGFTEFARVNREMADYLDGGPYVSQMDDTKQ